MFRPLHFTKRDGTHSLKNHSGPGSVHYGYFSANHKRMPSQSVTVHAFGGHALGEAEAAAALDSITESRWSKKLCSFVADIPFFVKINIVFILLMFFVTYGLWFKEFPGIAMGLIFAGCARLLLSITLHEYGHGLMAIALGGFCRAIELNALGGLAYCGRFSQQNPGKTGSAICSNILVSIAGPAMNAIQCGLLAWSLSSGGFLTNASPWPSPVYSDHPNLFWWQFVSDAFYMELANVVINVLPIIPGTDGTHIAQYFLRCCGFRTQGSIPFHGSSTAYYR